MTETVAQEPREESTVPLDLDALTEERDTLKTALRALETEQRDLEAQLKQVRQRELRTKREIEALSTLIELGQARRDAVSKAEGDDASEEQERGAHDAKEAPDAAAPSGATADTRAPAAR